MAEVADNVGRILAATAHAKGLELLVDVHPGVPRALLGDRVRLQQVLLNLGSNAVKFTSEGEVVIRASVLDWNTERVALRFEVIDMGIGIAPADQERLFRAFSQADSSTTRKFGGTGLGLAICRQLVELMGGKIGVVSAPGEGSTFWFELSLRRAETDAAARRPRASPRTLPASGRWSSTTTPPTAGSCASSCSSWGVEVRRGRRRLRGARAVAGAAPGRQDVRLRRGRPQHAGHGRHGAGRDPEGAPGDGDDSPVPAELVGRSGSARPKPTSGASPAA